ncbi:phospholipase C-like protein [Purpureocillium lilacinum]|uniref:Phospholipase C-like protein n=1 Tax=Purpureocillium lilacinum TaxID=33203 RepID=A0A179FEX1_PURLI|nr:phospholipase C-like protein [Purpureocillium lilacinum]
MGSFMPWRLLEPQNAWASGRQYITIVNLTPHRFKLDATHSYQMDEFDFGDVPQGRARQNTAHYTRRLTANPKDDNGEAYYSIEGTDKRFAIRATTHIPSRHWRRTVFDLNGMGMGQREYLDPGPESPVTLVITGSNSYGFIASIRYGPGNWMRSIYDVIKDRPIQHIMMPGTHDSGMSTISGKLISIGIPANTQNQGLNIYMQLRAGARWFDLRVATIHSNKYPSEYGFWVLHVHNERAELAVGNTGESLDDVVSEINKFTAENPGEVIFFRVSYLIGIRKLPSGGPIYWNKDIVNNFFGKLRAVNNRCPSLDTDIKFNKQPAAYFMDRNDGRGCVLFMLSGNLPDKVPQDSIGDGIYQGNTMDIQNSWSNLEETEPMAIDQTATWNKVSRNRGFSKDQFLISQWVVTPQPVKTTLLGLQNIAIMPTNPAIYWMGVNYMSPEAWPNVLMVDYYGIVVTDQTSWNHLSAELYTLAIGLNLYMISENCEVSTRRSPLLPKPRKSFALQAAKLASNWHGIIFANGTAQDNPPARLHLGRVQVLKAGTRFLNGTVLTKDFLNPLYSSYGA